jgi:hypothetical protein
VRAARPGRAAARLPRPSRDAAPPPDTPLDPSEKREIRDSLLTFLPAVLVAFVLRWTLVAKRRLAAAPRATLAAIAAGIVLALLLSAPSAAAPRREARAR